MREAPDPIRYHAFGSSEVVHTPLVTLGREDRPPHAEGWDGDHAVGDHPVLAFSRSPVRVRFNEETPTILSPAVVAAPRSRCLYAREPVVPEGQRSVWVIVRDDTLTRMAAGYDPSAPERPDRPLDAWTAPVDPAASVLAGKLASHAFDHDRAPDPVLLEEAVLRVCERTVRTAYASRGKRGALPRSPSPAARRQQLEALNAACEHICLNAGERLSLAEISDAAELSPGYLCRVFRQHLGLSVHEYLTRVRVLGAVDDLPAWRGRLSALARRRGFSSHAHLVTAFQRLLGASPSQLTNADARRWLAHAAPGSSFLDG